MSLYKEIIDKYTSIFAFTRVPENIPTAEVLFASLLRELNIENIEATESTAWKFSKDFKDFLLDKQNEKFSEISFGDWISIFNNHVSSIKSKEQTQNRDEYFYFNPIVPILSKFGQAARFKGNPWNPGALILEEIYLGCKNEDQWNLIESKLHENLSIQDNDDLWSRFLNLKTKELSDMFLDKSFTFKEDFMTYKFSNKIIERKRQLDFQPPINKVFVKYLEILLDLKDKFSRHRWASILQSYLRFSSFLLVLNKLTYSVNMVDQLMRLQKIDKDNIFKTTNVKLGDKRKELIEDRLISYLYSNLQLSVLLEEKVDENLTLDELYSHLFYDLENEKTNFEKINKISMDKLHSQYKEDFQLIKNDTIKNIREFLEYVGRDRSINNKNINGDIGYIYTIPNNSRSYVVEFGLGLTYTLVLLAGRCSSEQNDSFTANEFISFLSDFGLILTANDFNDGPLRNSLSELGLLLESPDSELGVSIKKIL